MKENCHLCFVNLGNFESAALRPLCRSNKGKERKSIYIAPFRPILRIVSKLTDMDPTVLPANCTMLAFPLKAFIIWRQR